MFFKKKVRVYGKTHFYKQGEIIYDTSNTNFPRTFIHLQCVCVLSFSRMIYTLVFFKLSHTSPTRSSRFYEFLEI